MDTATHSQPSPKNYPPLVVILGPTASGKTALALGLAQQFGGEIICADSRTIYRGMDIGTAKPTAEERQLVPHHVLDVRDPNEPFSAADFKAVAQAAIDDISGRSKVPFLVGGSGLYIDAVLFDYQFRDALDQSLRDVLEQKTVAELQGLIIENGYEMPENSKNKRYLTRTIETQGAAGERNALRENTLVIGIETDIAVLRERIAARVDDMLEHGFVEEYRELLGRYAADASGFYATGYKAFREYIAGSDSLENAKQQFIKNDANLAKRQRTWFRRPLYQNVIHWVSNRSQSVELLTTFLNK